MLPSSPAIATNNYNPPYETTLHQYPSHEVSDLISAKDLPGTGNGLKLHTLLFALQIRGLENDIVSFTIAGYLPY